MTGRPFTPAVPSFRTVGHEAHHPPLPSSPMSDPSDDANPGPLRILVVCTANRCRSPAAEVLLWRALTLAGVPAIVRSAGFLEPGHCADPTMQRVMAARGFDLSGHRSTQVSPEVLRGFDLILTMERRHARELVVIAGTDLPIFTLRGFAASAPAPSRRALLERGRADSLAGDQRGDEIADPIGKSPAVHDATVDELASASEVVAALLAGLPR
jgi:protein-tyrosine phosphatase